MTVRLRRTRRTSFSASRGILSSLIVPGAVLIVLWGSSFQGRFVSVNADPFGYSSLGAYLENPGRVLNDGSRFTVYKRYFTGEGLAAELSGGEVLFESRWFVAVVSKPG